MQMSPVIAIHLGAALAAVATGPVALWARLGAHQRPRLHRAFGYAWVTFMLVTAVSALFIRDTSLPNVAGYTPIHLLVPVTLVSVFGAFWKLAHGDIRGHASIMRRLYVGACLVAGAFTLLPQRYLGQLVWGGLGSLLPILRQTPAWVWLLLAALVALGATQLRDRDQGLVRASVMPLAMVGLSLWSATSAFGRSPLASEAMWLWLLAAAAATALVALADTSARYDLRTRIFHLPGSSLPLVLFMGVFLARYAVSVRLAMHQDLLRDASFVLPVAMLYGAFSGIFLGRGVQLWRLALRPAALPAAA